MLPKTFKCFRVGGPFTSQKGNTFYAGRAEVPNPVPGGYSTIRISVMSSRAILATEDIPGSAITKIDFDKGEASARLV